MNHKVVYLYQNSTSHLLAGDPEFGESNKGDVLPRLLNEGWRIVDLKTTGAAASPEFPAQVIAIVTLQK